MAAYWLVDGTGSPPPSNWALARRPRRSLAGKEKIKLESHLLLYEFTIIAFLRVPSPVPGPHCRDDTMCHSS